MPDIEVEGVSPEDMARELQGYSRRSTERKYDFQVGLKDVDFDIDQDLLTQSGLALPFQGIAQAEQALQMSIIHPAKFLEYDDTEHQVLIFDHRTVGYSGFMDCVTHSLAITDLGLFEVGRYPAVNLGELAKQWQWFLHRRLALPEQIASWQAENNLTSSEFLELVYWALTG